MRPLLLLTALLAATPALAADDQPFPLLRAWAKGFELDGEPKAPPPGTYEARVAAGKELYGPTCIRCHGWDSRGGGAAGVEMNPRPANLVDKPVKFRSTPPAAKPTELDLFRTITRGLHGTGMPPYADISETDRWNLAAYVHSLQPGAPAKPVELPKAPADVDAPARVAKGKERFVQAGCAMCHGPGNAFGAPEFEKTLPKRSRVPAELFATITLGMPGTPMPAHPLPADEVWDLVAYVRSRLPAPGSTGPNAQEQEAIGQVVDACADRI